MTANCDYLSATLRLTASVTPEATDLVVAPQFSEAVIVFSIEPCLDDNEDHPEIFLNRKQVQCLSDFLRAWLKTTLDNPIP